MVRHSVLPPDLSLASTSDPGDDRTFVLLATISREVNALASGSPRSASERVFIRFALADQVHDEFGGKEPSLWQEFDPRPEVI